MLEPHPIIAYLFPPITGEEFNELVADIKKHGLRQPIVRYEDMILDGCNRGRACDQAGVKPRYDDFTGNRAEALAFVISANIHRRHLDREQKRELVERLLRIDPQKSDRQIGKLAKVDKNTAAAARRDLEERGEIHHVSKRADTKGRKQPASKPASSKPVARPYICGTQLAECKIRVAVETLIEKAKQGYGFKAALAGIDPADIELVIGRLRAADAAEIIDWHALKDASKAECGQVA